MTMFAGVADAPVVNDQTGPVVPPMELCATICQKYCVLFWSVPGEYDACACPVDTCGGGLAVPNFTSYDVAPDELQVNVVLVTTFEAPLTGPGDDGVPGGVPPLDALTAAESNVAVFSCDVSWLVTMRPTSALVGRAIVVLPTVVHVEPSADMKPVTVVPERTSLSQTGAARVAPASHDVCPPLVDRVMNSMLPLGSTSRITCADPAVRSPRNITPAFALAFVFWMLVTRATI